MKKTVSPFFVTLALAAAAWAVSPGDTAPDFSLPDQTGAMVELSDYDGTIRVLEWTNPECPFVKRHDAAGTMKKLAAKYKTEGVNWFAVNSSHHLNQKVNAEYAAKQKLQVPVLTDQSGKVGRAYGAKTTPHIFIIDRKGTVVYAGAIDDDPRGTSKNPQNYVDEALAALVAGKAVAISETTPYGCSVKYGK